MKGQFEAFDYGSPCVQLLPDNSGMTGNEDCLYLNVYTPSVSTFDLFISSATYTPEVICLTSNIENYVFVSFIVIRCYQIRIF